MPLISSKDGSSEWESEKCLKSNWMLNDITRTNIGHVSKSIVVFFSPYYHSPRLNGSIIPKLAPKDHFITSGVISEFGTNENDYFYSYISYCTPC